MKTVESELKKIMKEHYFDRSNPELDYDNILSCMEDAYNLRNEESVWVKCSDKMPEEGKPVLGALQHWNTKNYRYYEIKKVNESDCEFGTVDDNSEISHDWTVTHWQLLQKPKDD